MAGSEAPALRKPPGTATPIRLPLPRQPPTLPFSATDPTKPWGVSTIVCLEEFDATRSLTDALALEYWRSAQFSRLSTSSQ